MFQPSPDDDLPSPSAPLPWTTPPSDLGHHLCGWCGRAIYAPALPCSIRPVPGLLSMETAPGLGDRCKWEMVTRGKGA